MERRASLEAVAHRSVVLARSIGFEWGNDTAVEPRKWKNHCLRTGAIWQNCADKLAEKC